jgi:uncharacterized protein (TIGR03437 family)
MAGGVLRNSFMRESVLACLALLSATSGMAQSSGFLLGEDYAVPLSPSTLQQVATDSSGAVYVLWFCPISTTSPSCLTKLSPNGATVWQYEPGFAAGAMAVDPSGSVSITSQQSYGGPPVSQFVEKLSLDGTSVVWKTALDSELSPRGAALDSAGHLYVAGWDLTTGGGFVAQVGSDGVIEFNASLTSPVMAVTIDGLGRPFVTIAPGGFDSYSVERLNADGSETSWVVSPPWQPDELPAVAADQNGNVWIFGEEYPDNAILRRFDAQGNQTLMQVVAGSVAGSLAVDTAGNAYLSGYSTFVIPMKNSLATCGTSYLGVFAPDGSLLQSTYVPSAGKGGFGYITMGPNSTVYAVGASPGPNAGNLLLRFSQNDSAQTVPLVCMGSAATYGTGPITPGEIVTLFGNGLGPEQGVQTQATLQSPFPTQVAGVKVTFDGNPAPLLWVQDGQINVVAPWSLTPGDSTQVCVSNNRVQTNCLTWPVAQTAPGVFTVDGTYAAALNQDGTINTATNPAQAGSVVSIFATGMGPINPCPPDGSLLEPPLPMDVLPMAVVYNAGCFFVFDCTFTDPTVSYQGPASLEVAGLTQISFQAPPPVTNSNATSGGDFWLTTGDAQSNQFLIHVTQ